MDNQIRVRSLNGKETQTSEYEGLDITFKGRGSTLIIGEGAIFVKSKVVLGDGGTVLIGRTNKRGLRNMTIDISGAGRNKSVTIGDECSCESMKIIIGREADGSVTIGRDCMISSNVTIRATDGHAIFDRDTRQILNRTRPISVGDHVWVGAEVTFMKGAKVSDNSVIGRSSLITRQFDESNVVLAGSPAKIVRTNIMWDRRYISHFEVTDYFVPEE